jgi:phytol kinase
MNDLLGLIIAYIYIFSVIGLAEGLRRWRGYGSDFTRKFIHIGVGMLSWLVPILFSSPWPFVLACLSFAVINFLDWRYGFFSSMVSSDRSNLGTVYFPIAAGVVAIIFWDQPRLLVAALMPLTWGDGIASVIGRKYGKHHYTVLGHARSIQGSFAFLIMAFVFTWLALVVAYGSPVIDPIQGVLPALTVAFVTTLAEAVSPWGLDNLIVPATSIVVLGYWPF